MKFKKKNGKFYVDGTEFADFESAWAELKKKFKEEK